MKDTAKTRALLERYLSQVRAGLRGLPSEQVDEILLELRSHIEERAEEREGPGEENMRASITALGEPEQIAEQYLTQNLYARATATRSPMLVLQSLLHWATLSLRGFCVALFSLLLYGLGLSFLMAAVLKPFRPSAVGLWFEPANTDGAHAISLSLGMIDTPVPGHEVLGWWIIPLGLLLGFSLIVATYRYNLGSIRELRRDWRARPLD